MDDTKTKMENLNKEIFNLETEIIMKKYQLVSDWEGYEKNKLFLMEKIDSETDELGKRLFTNESKRKLRFEELMMPNHELKVLKNQLETDDAELKKQISKLEFMKRLFDINEIFQRGIKQ